MDKRTRTFVVSFLAAIAVLGGLIIYKVQGTPQDKLSVAIGYTLLILFFGFGSVILLDMASGRIDMSKLLTEQGGGASMSRFQFMIFTFVIALSVFLIVAKSGQLPAIPSEVLTLLGISATTYGVSKGIQVSGGGASKETPTPPNPPAPASAPAPNDPNQRLP